MNHDIKTLIRSGAIRVRGTLDQIKDALKTIKKKKLIEEAPTDVIKK